MKPRASFVVEFGWFGFRIARRDVRLWCVRVWACRHSVLDQIATRTVLLPVSQPRDRSGRFVRVG